MRENENGGTSQAHGDTERQWRKRSTQGAAMNERLQVGTWLRSPFTRRPQGREIARWRRWESEKGRREGEEMASCERPGGRETGRNSFLDGGDFYKEHEINGTN